ncbi:glycosyltransferase [Candidatus Pelagibacter sp. FZCC0015]|uniref:glycosyltransferase n=1 Tax=Candidatus Pelagibacter sp. FZCC0015 TaxID=2268451 RepID=UPI0011A3FEEC|nr:glycosyltransferase [Candidatus Pelagibacter sp. FZCC0015]
MYLSIVIPVFNEKNNIEKLIRKINLILKKKKIEIIVVDDSSTDGTTQLLRNIQKKYINLKVIYRKNKKRDLSKSCASAFEKSKFKKIVVMDGDLQHDPIYIPKMLSIFEKKKCDIVIGSRNLINKRIKSLSFFRQLSSYFIIKLIGILFEKKTIDPMSGFFLFHKKIYIRNKKKLYLNGFKILTDLIYSQKNLIIEDLIIKFNYRVKGKSKLNLRVLLLLIKFIFLKFFKII